ncbi:MAG: hypothetical protein QM736_05325 [Vicinamibacterales bacterium]
MMSLHAVDHRSALHRRSSTPPRGYVGLLAYIRSGSLAHTLAAPVIYSLLLPFALLDMWVTVYQWICFPLYRIPLVRRREYLTFDRQTLLYLNPLEKLNCVFCGYVNGLVAYVREVGARTEQVPGVPSSTRNRYRPRTIAIVTSSTSAMPMPIASG